MRGLSKVRSRALYGVAAPEVMVEVRLSSGLPAFTVVGLAETEVKESRERVRSSLEVARFPFPQERVTVSLAPADLPKASARLDLPIALGIVAAAGHVPQKALEDMEFAGELSLDGALRPVRGVLPMVLEAKRAGRTFVLPCENLAEASLVRDAQVLGAPDIGAVLAHLRGDASLASAAAFSSPVRPPCPDFSEVKGQLLAKRGLEIAAAGGHNLLMIGPPGSGKSMLAERFPGILPSMSEEEARQSAAVWSVSDLGFDASAWGMRPFRAPHHSASAAALVGGGSSPKPGEVSLAHEGVLFLDELPEFDRRVLDMLREPMETGVMRIARAQRRLQFPARFQLLAAMNPCPCGYLGHPKIPCRCTPTQTERYRARVSGPFLDRVDIFVEVGALPVQDLAGAAPEEKSESIRGRVAKARKLQMARRGCANARLSTKEIESDARLAPEARKMLLSACERFSFSGRGYARTLKVARTVADLSESFATETAHLAEALQFRAFFLVE